MEEMAQIRGFLLSLDWLEDIRSVIINGPNDMELRLKRFLNEELVNAAPP